MQMGTEHIALAPRLFMRNRIGPNLSQDPGHSVGFASELLLRIA
jgi:hypothetical protein